MFPLRHGAKTVKRFAHVSTVFLPSFRQFCPNSPKRVHSKDRPDLLFESDTDPEDQIEYVGLVVLRKRNVGIRPIVYDRFEFLSYNAQGRKTYQNGTRVRLCLDHRHLSVQLDDVLKTIKRNQRNTTSYLAGCITPPTTIMVVSS